MVDIPIRNPGSGSTVGYTLRRVGATVIRKTLSNVNPGNPAGILRRRYFKATRVMTNRWNVYSDRLFQISYNSYVFFVYISTITFFFCLKESFAAYGYTTSGEKSGKIIRTLAVRFNWETIYFFLLSESNFTGYLRGGEEESTGGRRAGRVKFQREKEECNGRFQACKLWVKKLLMNEFIRGVFFIRIVVLLSFWLR